MQKGANHGTLEETALELAPLVTHVEAVNGALPAKRITAPMAPPKPTTLASKMAPKHTEDMLITPASPLSLPSKFQMLCQ